MMDGLYDVRWLDLVVAGAILAALGWALVAAHRRTMLALWLASAVAFLSAASVPAVTTVTDLARVALPAGLLLSAKSLILLGLAAFLLVKARSASPEGRWLVSVVAGIALMCVSATLPPLASQVFEVLGMGGRGILFFNAAYGVASVAGAALVAACLARRVESGAWPVIALAAAFIFADVVPALLHGLVGVMGPRAGMQGAFCAGAVVALSVAGVAGAAGVPPSVTCAAPSCGARNDPGASFCRRCGGALPTSGGERVGAS